MANKKINQLVSKTAILSTDIFGIGDATTGQLFKKTIAELQAAIGGAVISVNGLVGTVVLDTDDIQELATPTNKYFTDARARGAISLTVTGNSGASTYSSGTGVLNVPTYTLAGLGGISATFLSGTSGISYNSTTGVISYTGTVYTDASIRALLSAGTGISYNSTTGAISYSGTVYTDASVRALISLTTTGTSGASTYNNTTGVINVPNYTLAGLGGISLTSLSGGTGITYNNTTGAISYSGTVYTDASVRALFSASGAVSYNNTTGVISLTSGNLTEATSSVLTITGGTGAVIGSGTSIQVKQATTSVSGFLSSTDWTTFNNKQATVSLTTTGTSGAATFSANTLNIPNYGSALSGYLPLTGGTLTGALGGTSATFSSSVTAGSSGQVFLTGNAGTNSIGMRFTNTGGNSFIGLSNSIGTGYLSGTAYAFNIQTEGAQDLQFGTNNANRMTITSTGNVGISTSSPNDLLEIKSTSANNPNLRLYSTFNSGASAYGINWFRDYDSVSNTIGAFIRYTRGGGSDGDLIFGTGNNSAVSERMRITSAGNVQYKGYTEWLNGATSSFIISRAVDIVGGGNDMTLYTQSGLGMQFWTNGVQRMQITSAGNVGIGTSSPNSKLHVAGASPEVRIDALTGAEPRLSFYDNGVDKYDIFLTSGQLRTYGAVAGAYVQTIFSNGNIGIGTSTDNGYKLYVSGTIYATGNITANSDLTLKKNLTIIENPTDKLMQLNGYAYQWKSNDEHQYGVIAQEVEKILPYAVSTGFDGIKGVSYNQIIPVLIEAVKEQKKELEELRNILASK